MKRKAKIICTIGNVKKTLEQGIRHQLQSTITGTRELREEVKKKTDELLVGELRRTLSGFIENGMNVARLNMAHFDLTDEDDRDYVRKLIETIRMLSDEVAILGDLQGPKIRVKEFLGTCGGQNQVDLEGTDTFLLTTEETLSGLPGASIRKPEFLDFIGNIKRNIKDRNLPVEFWFADGEVILVAREEDIRENDAEIHCRIKVAGILKRNKGISVKNSSIQPGRYELWKYPKDTVDIEFLLDNTIDMLALSMVNTGDDVKSLQDDIGNVIGGGSGTRERKTGFTGDIQDFPIISKIETEEGVRHIDEIIDASYGVMVARGDLALQTRIQDIPILQKRIIEKCLLKAKPVITATQMLSWMMYFIEPKRAEATDVANAIFDGTDALMLSEETADPTSKYPKESITMMSDIAMAAENEIRERNTIEYKYTVDQLHEKIVSGTQGEADTQGKEQSESRIKADMDRVSRTVAYNACKKAFELRCQAIIVLTETGETARMISRFKPDMTIIAGVYSHRTARLLSLSYGVKAIPIGIQEAGYPFAEFGEVVEKAKELELLQRGDRVVTVGRFPRVQSGAVTLLNVFTIE
jgi:pyruvate kinase